MIGRDDTSILGRWWWTVDRWMLLTFIVMAGFGLMLIVSASPPVAERIAVQPLHFVRKQAILLIPALMLMIGISLMEPRGVRRLAILLLFGSLALCGATVLFGAEIKGATRWISLFGVALQPSEFLKPALAVSAGWMLASERMGERVPGFAIAMGFYVVAIALLLLQPDIGQAAVVTAIWFVQLFLAGLSMTLALGLLVLGFCGLLATYFIFDHVRLRIDRFFDPAAGDNYQINRSMEAFVNGGVLGRGPGEGTVKHQLPDGHADFIFAVAGEEFGLIACLLIVLLFGFVLVRGIWRLFPRGDLFTLIAAAGLLSQFALQALINMGSSLDLIPTKGMTLPFMSYGGSSLLALAVGMGMLLALTRKRPGAPE